MKQVAVMALLLMAIKILKKKFKAKGKRENWINLRRNKIQLLILLNIKKLNTKIAYLVTIQKVKFAIMICAENAVL
jgi:hypothetical protein